MSDKLTDAEVVRVLATREGWSFKLSPDISDDSVDGWIYTSPTGNSGLWFLDKGITDWQRRFNYLTSRDALAPILASLTDREWDELELILAPQLASAGQRAIDLLKFVFLLPPNKLARCVAQAIGEAGR